MKAKLIEDRLTEAVAEGVQLARSRRHDPQWIERTSAAIGDVTLLRRSFQRMHRRCQRAEADALREGQRADQLAGLLRQALTARRCA
jgi:hypothetical protein